VLDDAYGRQDMPIYHIADRGISLCSGLLRVEPGGNLLLSCGQVPAKRHQQLSRFGNCELIQNILAIGKQI
jgi:hypothetical protein